MRFRNIPFLVWEFFKGKFYLIRPYFLPQTLKSTFSSFSSIFNIPLIGNLLVTIHSADNIPAKYLKY